MTQISEQALQAAVREYRDPYLNKDLYELGAVKSLNADDNGNVTLMVELPYPSKGIAGALKQLVGNALEDVDGVENVDVHVGQKIHSYKVQKDLPSVPGVKNIIAVASGKGGVGKSTTAVNLALALQAEGARVGILDADIYGPSLPRLLHLSGRPEAVGGRTLKPMEAYGVKAMSMGFLVEEETPMIWRGPMVVSALSQMLREVAWGELDVLIVDMPPGTGDAQLTMAQQVPLAGAVIVSTPQDLALIDARKGLNMFRRVDVPVLGIIENMSYFVAPDTGKRYDIFGHGGARREAERLDAPFLGEVPLDMAIRETSDAGTPIVVADPEGLHAKAFRQIAEAVWAGVAASHREAPRIVIE